MSNHSEYLVEEVVMALINTRAAIIALPIVAVHSDSDTDAQNNRIVVKATRGELLLAGPGGYRYEVEVSIFGLLNTSANWETARREVELALNVKPSPYPAALTTALLPFTDFSDLPAPEREGARETSDNYHQSIAKVAFQVKEA